MIGKTIAHYRVTEKIGAGGMGVVYRATDTKLNRDVALKVLPEEFAKDHDRMARFKREAQVLASLNHPNIAAIYGLEQESGKQALVLELVEGPTLAERIKQGALPLDEALNIAKQIAEGLESAHEQGIIHRDLKPANVKVKEDGQVKVLDFGLAKALEGEGEADIENSPTLSIAATRAGVILGTAAYMSPEQARGSKVDKRTDIWAFGVVLFEMLSGQKAFTGQTISDVLASVLKNDINWDALPAGTPAQITKLLRRCLTADRKQRLQAIGEARIGIAEFQEDPEDASILMSAPASLPESQPGWKRALPWVFGGAMTLAFLLTLWSPWGQPERTSPVRLKVEINPEEPLFTGQGAAVALSPDGKLMAYVTQADGGRKLYVRSLGQLEGVPLSGAEGARDPFFSPDSRWIAFFTDTELKKVSVTGGAPLTLADTQVNRGGTWSEDGVIVFAPHTSTGLFRISAAGGTPEEITTPSEGERSHRWPSFLPGGQAVLFMAQDTGGSYDDATIEAVVLATGERKVIHEGGTYPRFLPTGPPGDESKGHLIYTRGGTIFAAPFDPVSLEMTGPPAPVLEGVVSLGGNSGNGVTQLAFSPGGTLVYLPGEGAPEGWRMALADRSGTGSFLPTENKIYLNPRLSPGGRQIAVQFVGAKDFDIWVYEIERGAMSRLTFEGESNVNPAWTPDGQRIAFSSTRGDTTNIYWKRADGAGAAEQLTTGRNSQTPSSFSPDGKLLAFSEQNPETGWDLWVLPLEGDRKPELFLATPATEGLPVFSPDGRWIAYVSNESGRFEVYVRPYTGQTATAGQSATAGLPAIARRASAGKWQISTNGGAFPRWTKNGRELIYREGANRWMRIPVTTQGDSFRAGKPELLFETNVQDTGPNYNYDVSRDGEKFVLLQREEQSADSIDRSHLTFIFNWFDEVRRLTASGDN